MSVVDKIDKAADWFLTRILATAPYLGFALVAQVAETVKATAAEASPWLVVKASLHAALLVYLLRVYLTKSRRSGPARSTTIVEVTVGYDGSVRVRERGEAVP